MGSNKLLASIWGRPLVVWSVESALSSGSGEVIVVLGLEAERVREVLPPGVRVVMNREWMEGVSSSIRRGVEAVDSDSEAAVIMVADQPLTPPAIPAILASLILHGRHPLASAAVGGMPRNPAAFHRRLFGELLALRGDKGARSVIDSHLSDSALLEVPEDMLLDVDTAEDLAGLSRRPPPRRGAG